MPIRGNNLAARHAMKEICQICTKNGLSLFIQPSQAVYQNLRQHNLIGDAMKWGLGEVDSSCESEPNDLSRFAYRISNSRFNTTALILTPLGRIFFFEPAVLFRARLENDQCLVPILSSQIYFKMASFEELYKQYLRHLFPLDHKRFMLIAMIVIKNQLITSNLLLVNNL